MCVKYIERYVTIKQELKKWIVIILTIAISVWQYVFIHMDINSKLGSIYRGTQVTLTWANALEVILLFFWFKDAVELFEESAGKCGKGIVRALDWLGRYTLYIFLYHMLFLSIYERCVEIIETNINGVFCLIFIIAGPIMLGILLGYAKKYYLTHITEIVS